MGITISSRSPAMAFSDGGLWVSTFDERGRRCWVNNITGERTYQFIRGKPVTPSTSPYAVQRSPVPSPSLHHVAPWAHSMASPSPPAPGYPAPLPPAYGGGAGGAGGANGAMVPCETGYGVPPITPEGNGGWAHRLKKCYLRPSTNRSWMWN
eukprot:g15284.t1